MIKFLKTLLLPLTLLLTLSGCNINEGSKNLNDETTTYKTTISGNILNVNIDDSSNSFDVAIVKITGNGETKEATINYPYKEYNFEIYHNGTLDIEVTTPNMDGYKPYKETLTDITSSTLKHDIKLESDTYKYLVKIFDKRIYSIESSSTELTNTTFSSDNMSLITRYYDSTLYIVDENFSYTISAPGFHIKNNQESIKTLPIWPVDESIHYINRDIVLYPESYQMTRVGGNVYFKNSTVPIRNISVRSIGDYYSPVYADSNGFYSIDIYHDGFFRVNFESEDAWTIEEFTTTESIIYHDVDIYPDTSKWGEISGRIFMDQAKTEPLQGARVTLGEFSPVTDQYGQYQLFYLKNTDQTMTITAIGYETVTENINSDADLAKSYSLVPQ